ncbi:MAG: hypothetical protein WA376_16915, partial [Terrimicrobiaceae bacterium]
MARLSRAFASSNRPATPVLQREVKLDHGIVVVQLAGPKQDRFCTFNALTAASRIGQVDPPAGILRLGFDEVICNRCGHVPLLGRHVKVDAGSDHWKLTNQIVGMVPPSMTYSLP